MAQRDDIERRIREAAAENRKLKTENGQFSTVNSRRSGGCKGCSDPIVYTPEELAAAAARKKAATKGRLNAEVACRFPTIPAEPRTETVTLPGHTVAYDVHSMAAVEMLPEIAPPAPSSLKPQFQFFGGTECRYVVLNVTHACNLACEYCFVRNYSENQGGLMTMDTARRAIALVSPGRDLRVGFFGGEPLLAWPLIQEVVAYVKDLAVERKGSPSFHVTTNGLLLDDEKVQFLDKHGFSLIVSLDGPEAVHNRLRPAKNPETNSHAATLAAVRRLKGTGLARRTTLRSTYTGLGLARRSLGEGGADLVARLDFLNALVREGCAGHVSVEPCSLNESACLRLPDGHPLSITPDHYDALTREYHAAAEWFVAEVRAGRRPTWHHLTLPLRRLLYTEHAPSECGAGCGYMSVDPSGVIYACHREGPSSIGHLDTGVDEELRAKWKDNRLYARPDCTACPIKHVCGGGCRLDSLERLGDIRKPDPVGCFFRRRMFEEALWVLCELGPEKLATIIRNPRENRRPLPGRRFTRPMQGPARVARA